jgi:hypothetical protein
MLLEQQLRIFFPNQLTTKYVLVYGENEQEWFGWGLDGADITVPKEERHQELMNTTIGMEDVHRFFEHQVSEELLRKILSMRRKEEWEHWSRLLKQNLYYHREKKNEWFTQDQQWNFFCIKGFLNLSLNAVECSIDRVLLSKMNYGKKNILIFILEEFGTFYTDGLLLKNEFMRKIQPDQFFEQHEWTLRIDYVNYFKFKHFGHYPYITNLREDIWKGIFDCYYGQEKNAGAKAPLMGVVDLSLRRNLKHLFDRIKNKKRSLPTVDTCLRSSQYRY